MEAYEQAIDRYNEGSHLEAFHLLLDHLNPEFRTKYGNAGGTEFHIPHGSILVNILVAEDKLQISADFLELPEKGRVAMLRQVADLNINRLMLPRFRKNGDTLKMEYACPLSQSHPHKIYFILRNICHIGDRYEMNSARNSAHGAVTSRRLRHIRRRKRPAFTKRYGKPAAKRSTR